MPGKALAVAGGVLAAVAGVVSIATQVPLITHLAGAELVSGPVLIPLGALGILGGLLALYGGLRAKPGYAVMGGALGLLAPCGLSLLAVIGGALMRRQPGPRE
jgi:hypothetical protein